MLCNVWALKGNWLRGTLVTADTRQNVPTSWPKKELVMTSMISGFCHSASEFIALLGCYAAQISIYQCFSTTVCPFNGQALQAWPSDIGLHISTDLTSWRHIIMSYFYRTDNLDKVAQQTVIYGLMLWVWSDYCNAEECTLFVSQWKVNVLHAVTQGDQESV